MYVIDTSALLDGAKRWYRMKNFPGFWKRMDDAVESGEIVSIEDVFIELERQKGDEIFEWAKARRSMFWPLTEEVQIATSKVLDSLETLVDERRDRSRADPFVVGLAKVHQAAVITGETRSRSAKRPKIPEACHAAGVRCMSLPDLIAERDWTFE